MLIESKKAGREYRLLKKCGGRAVSSNLDFYLWNCSRYFYPFFFFYEVAQ